MTVESIVDANEKAQPEDEGCEYCGCALYPHTEEDDIISTSVFVSFVLRCENEECENYHKPVGGFSV
jgi:hypothetical protein